MAQVYLTIKIEDSMKRRAIIAAAKLTIEKGERISLSKYVRDAIELSVTRTESSG